MRILFTVLSVAEGAALLLSGLYALYLGIIALAGLFPAKKLKPADGKRIRFAILVPARNEESVIAGTVKSLLAQEYPRELFDVYVLPNNCRDATEEKAREAGALILSPEGKITSKGDVLRIVVDALRKEKKYDAFAVFDADNRASPGFLRAIAGALDAGYEVAQGFRESSNPTATFTSASCSVYYWMDNYFYSQARWNLGGSALINGTGFAFTEKAMEKSGGWDTVTLVEDIEYSGRCAINGLPIAWVPDAITYDEQPENFVTAWKQRMRWTVGMYQCIKALNGKLFSSVGKAGRSAFMLIDMLLFYAFPIFGIIGTAAFVTSIARNIVGVAAGIIPWYIALLRGICGLAGMWLGPTLLALAASIRAKKGFRTSVKGIFGFFVFVMSWVPIAVLALFRKDQKWDEISHRIEKDVDSLINDRQ